ncbi:MAG: ribosome biogenesis GTPase YlqF [Lachnospiraceae bacterium]|nr:ribosome biogenesis GTPase YlqF [Lachnospiraceae bacterium]
MEIQWYPGHMAKAKRMMQEDVRLVDLVIEILDARLPLSSRNPDIDELGKNKQRLIILNKADLADEAVTAGWKKWFEANGCFAVTADARVRGNVRNSYQVIEKICREKTERDRKRGILNRPVRAMVAGIPNVGKSTWINSYVGRASAKTGNKPGVTKGKQWIRLGNNLELLDTPGILWPKFQDPEAGLKLALVGTINDDILEEQTLAVQLLRFLNRNYPGRVEERYGVGAGKTSAAANPEENDEHYRGEYQLLNEVAVSRGALKKGGEGDLSRAASLLLDDFRSGRLGRISLEKAPGSSE